MSLQFKTGIRLRLTSSVKEIGAILQKLIWTWINPGQNNEKHDGWASIGDADWLVQLLWDVGIVGSVQTKEETETILFSQELEKWEKKPF